MNISELCPIYLALSSLFMWQAEKTSGVSRFFAVILAISTGLNGLLGALIALGEIL